MRLGTFVALALACAAAQACTTDLDCSLLGVCDTSTSTCTCDVGWTGEDCGVADLEPFQFTGYVNATSSSWGGNAFQTKDGMWHLFMSEMANSCPLRLFGNVSTLSHAVSKDLLGNFTSVGTVRGPFGHNTTPVQDPSSGILAVYAIASPEVGSDAAQCFNGTLPPCATETTCGVLGCCKSSPRQISVVYGPGVDGPWKYKEIEFTGESVVPPSTNPTVIFFPNGTALMAYRGKVFGGEGVGTAVADSYAGPFRVRNASVVTVRNDTGDNEDPHLWMDGRGNFHILTHNQGPHELCPGHCGAHAYSTDSYTWHISRTPVYSGAVVLPGGGNLTFTARQRPQVTFAPNGQPLALWNGASMDGTWKGLHTTTHTYSIAFKGAAEYLRQHPMPE